MDLVEFYDYKNLLMKDLCCNENVVKLVTGNDAAPVPNHKLPYTQIFPYEYVDATVDEAKTYICFDVDIVSVPNKTYYIPVLYIWIFTHKSLLRMPNGTLLLDRLSAEINLMLNGSRYFGLGELKLDSVNRFYPIHDYSGRALVYYARDWNRLTANKSIPSNRKLGR